MKGNPGKPAGARDRAPRAPRFWKELTAKMAAGVVRLHAESQRQVLFNPGTEEPLTDLNGSWIYDPTYDQVAAAAILYGGLHPQDSVKFTEYEEPRESGALLPGNYRKRPANTGVNADGSTRSSAWDFMASCHEIPAAEI